ncbi:MAG: alpha/beta hydrolase [Bacteroidota bacterium]|nr:alpha/beta hydrolase [Bacteroidota bacterium]
MNVKENVEAVVANHLASGKFIDIGGVNTFYLDKGKGEIVFCIHGVPTSSFIYRKVIDKLEAKGMRGIAIDLPGLGFSDRPEDFDYRFSNFASFCKKFLDKLNLEKVHLLLHDIGTPIGLALTARNNDNVKSITILNSMLNVAEFKKPFPMQFFEKAVIGEAELALFTYTTWKWMAKYAAIERMDTVKEEEILAYVDILKRADQGKAFLKIMRNFESSSEFTRLCYSAIKTKKHPFQLIWGMKDPFLPFQKYGVEFLDAGSPFNITKLESKHFLQEEKAENISYKIIDMITELKIR